MKIEQKKVYKWKRRFCNNSKRKILYKGKPYINILCSAKKVDRKKYFSFSRFLETLKIECGI